MTEVFFRKVNKRRAEQSAEWIYGRKDKQTSPCYIYPASLHRIQHEVRSKSSKKWSPFQGYIWSTLAREVYAT